MLPRNKKELKPVRARLRQNMPMPEVILWQSIRRKQLGVKFRRQFSIGNFILDFYAPKIKLGIEIDGETHFFNRETREKDEERDKILARQGIRVLRFLNTEIMKNLEGVIREILDQIHKTPS